MPCDGIAVATAKIEADLEAYLRLVDQTILDDAIAKYLKILGYTNTTGTGYYQTFNSNGMEIEITIQGIFVQVVGEYSNLQDKLTTLLTGLAQQKRQQIALDLLAQNTRVNKATAAPNGAIVLNVTM